MSFQKKKITSTGTEHANTEEDFPTELCHKSADRNQTVVINHLEIKAIELPILSNKSANKLSTLICELGWKKRTL